MNSTLAKTLISVATLSMAMVSNASAQFTGMDKVPPSAAPETQPPAPDVPAANGLAQNLYGCLMGREDFSLSTDLKSGFETWDFMGQPHGSAPSARSQHSLALSDLGLTLDLHQALSGVTDVPPWWNTIRNTLQIAATSNFVIGVSSNPNGSVSHISVSWGTPCPYSSGY